MPHRADGRTVAVSRPISFGDQPSPRARALTLPVGRGRDVVRQDGRDYRLRGSEVILLEHAAQFRVVFTDDCRHGEVTRRLDGDVTPGVTLRGTTVRADSWESAYRGAVQPWGQGRARRDVEPGATPSARGGRSQFNAVCGLAQRSRAVPFGRHRPSI